MHPYRGGRRREAPHPLRQQSAGDPGQHIPGAGSGQRRRGVAVDHGPAIRRGNHRVAALEHHHGARSFGPGPRPIQLRACNLPEDPLELALVRRHHHRSVGLCLDRRKERLRIVLEAGQGVGVENRSGAAAEDRQDVGPGMIVNAGRGADHRRGDPLVVQHQRQSRGAIDRLEHDRREVRRLDQQGIVGAHQRHQPGTAAQRRDGGEPARSGVQRPAGDHDTVTAGELVAVRLEPGQGPQAWAVLEGFGPDLLQDIIGNADVRQHQFPAPCPARLQHMPRLLAKEADRQLRLDGSAADRPACAVNPAGHVDRDHRLAAGVDRLDQRRQPTLDIPVEAGSKQRIDDQFGAPDDVRNGAFDHPPPEIAMEGGVPLEPVLLPEQGQPHRPAALLEQPRHHEAVAAVVARAAQHQRLARHEPSGDGVGDRPAGILHQVQGRNARLHRHRVCAGHLDWGQQNGIVRSFHRPTVPPPRRNKKAARWGGPS